jgi:hypothetical protein
VSLNLLGTLSLTTLDSDAIAVTMASNTDEDRRARVEISLTKLSKMESKLEKLRAEKEAMQAKVVGVKARNPALNHALPEWKQWEWIKSQMEVHREHKVSSQCPIMY